MTQTNDVNYLEADLTKCFQLTSSTHLQPVQADRDPGVLGAMDLRGVGSYLPLPQGSYFPLFRGSYLPQYFGFRGPHLPQYF